MPRRPARDSRAALFRAAAREFAARGYDAAGTDRIAARARVNKAMLYYHFGSKRALYLEVVRDMVVTVGARVRAIADGGEGGGNPAALYLNNDSQSQLRICVADPTLSDCVFH
jgi:AcrR family transcriptional regulator